MKLDYVLNHSRWNWQYDWEGVYDYVKIRDQLACLICSPFMLDFNIKIVFIKWQVLCIEKKSTCASHVLHKVKLLNIVFQCVSEWMRNFNCGSKFSSWAPWYLQCLCIFSLWIAMFKLQPMVIMGKFLLVSSRVLLQQDSSSS